MANKAISTLAVGSSVYLNVGGTRTEFLVVHQGLPSSMYDASCNGTWLLMKDCYEKRQWHSSNVNKLESSDIYSYLNGPFLNLFDSNIRDAIKQVKIPYRQNGGSGGSDQSGANGLSCKVFLLSGYEVGFTQSNISNSPVDGAKLDYFESGTSWPARSKRIAYMNGSAVYWYLRSPLTNSTLTAMSVGDDGYPAVRNASDSYGIRPALVLPPNLLVDDSGNVSVPDLTAHKTLINGTAYTVQGGKCMVNGTVYNILKGRTLIDGTGYDIVFPVPLVMPVKGDLITMNLDGTDRQYRVLKIIGDTTIEVLGMWDVRTSIKFNLTANNAYRESYLDTYLNTTYYKTLSANAKAAIVAKSINQYQYTYDGSAYKHSTHASYADYSTKSQKESIGDRYVYVLDVEDVEMYFGGTGGSTDNKVPGNFSGTDLIQMFWGNESTASGYIPLLRSGSTGDIRYIWRVDPNASYISRGGSNVDGAARPAFQIDLSKIDFTIN